MLQVGFLALVEPSVSGAHHAHFFGRFVAFFVADLLQRAWIDEIVSFFGVEDHLALELGLNRDCKSPAVSLLLVCDSDAFLLIRVALADDI